MLIYAVLDMLSLLTNYSTNRNTTTRKNTGQMINKSLQQTYDPSLFLFIPVICAKDINEYPSKNKSVKEEINDIAKGTHVIIDNHDIPLRPEKKDKKNHFTP